MTMRATTVRFSEDVWQLLEREAAQQGISSAQFVRDAALMRIAFLMADREDPAAAITMEDLNARMAVRRRSAPSSGSVAGLDDPSRLAKLRATKLLDSPPEEAFDRFTRLAARVVNAPVALISLVDAHRQFFKSAVGLPEPYATRRETPHSHSFCQHTVARREPLVVSDAREHPLVRENLAISDLDVVAYAGVPLITSDGQALGALCAIDHKPRIWTSDQIETLSDIAAAITTEMELRAAAD